MYEIDIFNSKKYCFYIIFMWYAAFLMSDSRQEDIAV